FHVTGVQTCALPILGPMTTTTRLPHGLLVLMSAATGLAVAGNYFAQPLLDLIGRDLGLAPSAAALLVTAAQAGYALGLILLVPRSEERRVGKGGGWR